MAGTRASSRLPSHLSLASVPIQKFLSSLSVNVERALAEALYGRQNIVSRLGPAQGFRVLILVCNEGLENRVLSWPLVRECYMLSGETDFLLKCVAPDLTAFLDFVIDELTAAPNVASVKTTLVIRRVKFEPGVPVALAQRRRAG